MGLSRSAGAVDAVFDTIGEALAKREEVRTAEFVTFIAMNINKLNAKVGEIGSNSRPIAACGGLVVVRMLR